MFFFIVLETWWKCKKLFRFIRVRDDYIKEASQKLERARVELRKETTMIDDPAILAAEGYICEQNGNLDGAEEKYLEALGYNYAHKYTIYYYSKLLERLGREPEARLLKSRSEDFNESQTFENLVEYEFLSKNDELFFDDEY